MEPKSHTPGPWNIDLQSPHCPIVIKPHPGNIICDICGIDSEAHANARPIAAAPEMLQTCKLALQTMMSEHPDWADAHDRLHAVIAKAEGEPGIGDLCPCCGNIIEAVHACN